MSAHESGAFPDVALDEGELGMAAILPDLLSCHDWGYTHAWSLVGAGTQAELVLAHMLGDAVVHYGLHWQGHERKRGWAYLRMGLVTRRCDEFYEQAEQSGWREPGLLRDSRRGWAHTLTEYAIDQWLCDRRDLTTLFERVRAAALDTAADLSWVHDLVTEHVITPSKPIETQPYRYCGALSRSTRPDEFHLRGLAVKFHLAETPESLDWIRGWLRDIWRAVGEDEMSDVLRGLSDATADPVRFGYPLEIAHFADRPHDRWPRMGRSAVTAPGAAR
ncbi:hypothetical protein [Nonomuraea lactucae]|uniref:hypothetical protein n=1 Tax=Nonomuraea lactucae TaxID=2249762 RepID=UPI0019626218|nr:hypothetical protein [Nonomuraea lactucae]